MTAPASAPAPAPTRAARSPLPDIRRVPRRRGWSPGAVTAVLAVASLSLMLLDVRGGPTDVLRGVAAAAGGPLQSASSGLLGTLPEQIGRPDAAGLQQELEALRAENERLALGNELLADQLAAVTGEQVLEAFRETVDGTTVIAKVVAASTPPAQAGAAVTIDAGSDAGIRPDSAVVVPSGLVGRVVDVGPVTSTVQLVTGPDSGVAVRLQRTRQTGLAQGTGDPHQLNLRHVDPLAAVQPGEPVVTLGSPGDRPFPPGLVVGTITAAGPAGDVNRTIELTPAVPSGTLDRVLVLTGSVAPPTAEAER